MCHYVKSIGQCLENNNASSVCLYFQLLENTKCDSLISDH